MKHKQLSTNIKIAEELRSQCNKLSNEERERLLQKGMELIRSKDKSNFRPTFEEAGILSAHNVALRSEDRFVRVGCVAYDINKKIKGTGYNGFKEGQEVPEEVRTNRDLSRMLVRHAEANCLAMFTKGEAEYLFLTMSPCTACSTNIAAMGIKKVYFSKQYLKGGIKPDLDYKIIFDFYGIEYKLIPYASVVGYLDYWKNEENT